MNDPDRWPAKYRSREERLERRKILSERLPKVMSGFGVHHGERPIHFLDADTDAEQSDAIEFYEINRSLADEKLSDQGMLDAVRWARQVFHEHGYPSRCYIFIRHKSPNIVVVNGKRRRRISQRFPPESTDLHQSSKTPPCLQPDFFRIYDAVDLGMLPDTDPGSPLCFAGHILSCFSRLVRVRRRQIVLDREFLARELGPIRPEFDPDIFRPHETERLMADTFKLAFLWGALASQIMLEDEVLAKRADTYANRANADKAAAVNKMSAEQRRAYWFRHLDEQAETRQWRLWGDKQRLVQARRSFDQKLKMDDDGCALFKIIKRKEWYEDKFEEWRQERLSSEQ